MLPDDPRGAAAAGGRALDIDDAALLVQAEFAWRTIQGLLRVTVGQIGAEALPTASAGPLLRAAAGAGLPAVDTSELLHKSDLMAQQVRRLFERYVGKTD